jgi:hypothetical protein
MEREPLYNSARHWSHHCRLKTPLLELRRHSSTDFPVRHEGEPAFGPEPEENNTMNATQKTTVQTQETVPGKKLIRPRGEKLRRARLNKLKAERVQEKMAAQRFTRRLQILPGWNLTEDNKALVRQRQFPDTASAASYALHAMQLVLGQGQALSVSAFPGQVVVLLHGVPRGSGYRLAEDTLELAERLG